MKPQKSFLSDLLNISSIDVAKVQIIADNAKSHPSTATNMTTKTATGYRRHSCDGSATMIDTDRWSCCAADDDSYNMLLLSPNTGASTNSNNNRWDQFSSNRAATRRNTVPSFKPPLHKRSPPVIRKSTATAGGRI